MITENNKLFTKPAILTKTLLLPAFLLTFLGSGIAHAETGYLVAKVNRTLADTAYGGCMVLLDSDIANVLPSCFGGWVSLDCNAEYHTPEQSSALWDSALMAFALDKTIAVYVDDTQMVNGYCTVRRIDVLK